MNADFANRLKIYQTGIIADGPHEREKAAVILNELICNYNHVKSEFLKLHKGSKGKIDTLMDAVKDTVQIIENVFNDTGKIIDFEDQILKRLQKALTLVNKG